MKNCYLKKVELFRLLYIILKIVKLVISVYIMALSKASIYLF